jgi:folate-binding protein YgfZ
MNTQPIIPFGTLKISGADAMTFLQGQLTCDMRELPQATHQLGAFCNRQGRVLALMDIFRIGEDYILTLPQEILEPIQQELKKYIVFSKTKIDNISQDYRLEISTDFLHQQMRALIPFIGQAQTGKFLPHPLGLIRLGAVSFKKGCFVGQEIIARMQHRTTITKELQYVDIHQAEIPNIGEQITWDNQHTGILVNSLLIAPQTYATLVITDTKMLYTTTDQM